MDFQEDSLDTLRSIVRTAFKYNVKSGLQSSIPDLRRIRKSFLEKGMYIEVEEIDFIINFLNKEREVDSELHFSLLKKTRELAESIPIGMIVNFRFNGETLNGELRGFVADRVLILSKFKGQPKLFEVNPFDLKL
jgi:hypothetical protein